MTKRMGDAIFRKARSWAGQLTSLARSFAPTHIRDAISSHVEEGKEGRWIIRITADRRIAPDARAWEFGSGLHARRGIKAKYPILPKNKKFLAFPWEVASNNPEKFRFLPDGRVLLSSVQHPGIVAANEGKGYIAPAMKELRRKGKEELTKEVKQAILGDLRESFGRKV